MPRANIYIRKDNQARWDAIVDKSAWVNAILEKSPPNSRVLEQNLEPAVERFGELKDMDSTKIIPLPTPVKQAKKTISIGATPVCKIHATPLDGRGKCLQKGCKYA